MNSSIYFIISLVAVLIFLGASIIAHIINKNYSFSRDAISQYVHAKKGWIVSFGFISITISQYFLAYGLFVETSKLLPSILIAIASIGALIVTIFPTDKGTIKTTPGQLHAFGAALEFILIPIAILLYYQFFESIIISSITLVCGLICGMCFAIISILFIKGTMKTHRLLGLIEKTLLISLVFWIISVSIYFI